MSQTVLITGGARRIGRSMALFLAKSGYDIALHYHQSQEDAESLCDKINSLNVCCRIFQADLASGTEAEELMARVCDDFSSLNILINNAAIFKRAPLKETGNQLLNETIDINFKAPYILTREFASRVQEGLIINLLDTKIMKNNFYYSAYTLSKKMLAELTKMSAKELAPAIRVNGICPGLILPPEGEDENYLAEMAKKIPLQSYGDPEAINNALLYFIENKFVTGQFLFIDGGQNL